MSYIYKPTKSAHYVAVIFEGLGGRQTAIIEPAQRKNFIFPASFRLINCPCQITLIPGSNAVYTHLYKRTSGLEPFITPFQFTTDRFFLN